MAIDKKTKEFGTPQQVFEVTEEMQRIEDLRATDRSMINALFNGKQPYPDDEDIDINVNWGEGKRIMLDANRQLNNSLLHPGTLFNAIPREGRVDKRDEWSLKFTTNLHIPLQEGTSGKRYHFLIRSRNATVCMHGIGALLWPNSFRWLPRYVPLEDLLIPTDTYCDFTNLRYFGVNLYLSPGELIEMTQGDVVDKGWNQKQVKAILKAQKGVYSETTSATFTDQPEEYQQLVDQNRGYYYSDAMPKIRLRAFYWKTVDDPVTWYRNIILRETTGDAKTDQFVYNGSESFATDLSHILNIQYGDSNLTAPLKYHSVRGLGVDLFAPVDTLNRLRCEYVQAVFEHLKMYFKIQDPADRDRLKHIVLQNFGFIPEGLNIVKREERHQIDPSLVANAMSQMRQIMQESSSSYLQDAAAKENREMTAKEAMIRLNQATVMISGMLQMMYIQEAFFYQELVRRFCLKESADKEVKEFRERCIKDGIPEYMIDASKWKVVPERVIGNGDRTTAQTLSEWLLQRKNIYDPAAQQKILWWSTATMLDDPAKADMLVPRTPITATDGTHAAENVFGTLMDGVQVSLRQGIDQIGYIEAMLTMMGTVVQRIESTDNIGTPQELVGLVTVAQNVSEHMMILAADDSEKQRVKQYGDALGEIMNRVKGFAQRQAQQRAQKSDESGENPQDAAKVKATLIKAQVNAQIKQQQAAMRQREKELEFQLDQARENMRTVSELKREDLAHKQRMLNQSLEQAAALLRGIKSTNNQG